LLKNNRYPLTKKARTKPLGLAMTSSTDAGGADRDRTDDPLLAKQVLSQLSYSPRVPNADGGSGWTRTIDPRLIKTVL
jgi:hypothetical protein